MTTKRLLIIIAVLAVILVGLATYTSALLLSRTGQASVSTVTPTPSNAPITVPTTKTNKTRKFIGTIQSLGNQTFTLTPTKGKKTITVNVDDQTTYTNTTANGSAASFSNLKVGQMVEVKGHSDPQDSTVIQAVSIIINPPTTKPTPTPTSG
jgi:hypothetical protein